MGVFFAEFKSLPSAHRRSDKVKNRAKVVLFF